jgi:16S rRNA (guanine966-N2)-methyltransferase
VTRIVAGRIGGRRLEVPPAGTRPTSDRTREALFSAWTASLGSFDGLRVLDLYAGSGAIGLEAWSRGAASVVLVESASAAVLVLKANVAALVEPAAAVQVISTRAEVAVRELQGAPFDVVFADPPYAMDAAEVAGVLTTLVDRGLLAGDASVVVERGAREAWEWPAGIDAARDRRYGDSVLWYGRARWSEKSNLTTEVS